MRSAFIYIITLLCIHSVILGQGSDTSKVKKSSFDTYDELKQKTEKDGVDSLFYLDSTFNYQVYLPGWLKLIESGVGSVGGTLPAVQGIENAIVITGFPKSEYKSFDEFKDFFLTGNKFGEPMKWSKEHICYGKKDLIEINKGVKQTVYWIWRNKIYFNNIVLIETKSAYLWIRFVATGETYDVNISKFEEFMAGFKQMNF